MKRTIKGERRGFLFPYKNLSQGNSFAKDPRGGDGLKKKLVHLNTDLKIPSPRLPGPSSTRYILGGKKIKLGKSKADQSGALCPKSQKQKGFTLNGRVEKTYGLRRNLTRTGEKAKGMTLLRQR